MSKFKERLEALIKLKLTASATANYYRTSRVASINSDGSITSIVDGAQVTATPLYPIVKGQEVVLMFDQQGKISAVPTRPNVNPLVHDHGQYLDGGIIGPLRVVTSITYNGLPGLIFQQQKDSNYYFYSETGGTIPGPLAFSPDGTKVTTIIFNNSGGFYSQVYDIGTARFKGTPSGIDALVKNITGMTVRGNSVVVDAAALVQTYQPDSFYAGGIGVESVAVDNDGTSYYSIQLSGATSATLNGDLKSHTQFWEVPSGVGSTPILKGSTYTAQTGAIGPTHIGTNYITYGIIDGKNQVAAGGMDSTNQDQFFTGQDTMMLVQDNSTNGLGSYPTPYFIHTAAGGNLSFTFTPQAMRSGNIGAIPYLKTDIITFGVWIKSTLPGSVPKEYNLTVLNPPGGSLSNFYLVTVCILGTQPAARVWLHSGGVFFSAWVKLTIDDNAQVITINCNNLIVIDPTSINANEKYDFYPASRNPPDLNPNNPRAYGITGLPN